MTDAREEAGKDGESAFDDNVQVDARPEFLLDRDPVDMSSGRAE
jgi:hypothetical protein